MRNKFKLYISVGHVHGMQLYIHTDRCTCAHVLYCFEKSRNQSVLLKIRTLTLHTKNFSAMHTHTYIPEQIMRVHCAFKNIYSTAMRVYIIKIVYRIHIISCVRLLVCVHCVLKSFSPLCWACLTRLFDTHTVVFHTASSFTTYHT